MFALAWIFLADQPAYRTGVIVVGLARCIAMVLVWNDIALGDREAGGGARRLQLALPGRRVRAPRLLLPHGPPGLARLRHAGVRGRASGRSPALCSSSSASRSLAGFLTRYVGIRRRGRTWYEQQLVPRISPLTLYGLLFTIVLLFAIQGDEITEQPLDVVRIAVPLLVLLRAHVDRGLRRQGASWTSRIPRPPRSPSPSRATTSSSQSRSPSASSAPRRARRSPGSSAR